MTRRPTSLLASAPPGLIALAPLLSLALLAAWPLLRLGLPTGGDGLTHYYRILELDWSIRHGNLFPRWLPDLGYGYGIPIYVFYPPLSHYLAEGLHLLGLGLRDSVWAAYLAAPALAIFGMYFWARELLGQEAALVAAAAYALTPYFYFDLLARAALAEALALGLFPWLFWAYHRLNTAPTARRFIVATLLYAALVLAHILSAAFITPILIIYLWALSRSCPPHAPAQDTIRHSSFIVHPSSLLLALLLTAFWWFPGLYETRWVRGLPLGGGLDYRNNFLFPAELFSLPRPFDPRQIFFRYPISLPWPQIGLALIGAIGALSLPRSRPGRYLWLSLLAALAVLLVCMLPISLPFWEILPFSFSRLVQFPWRLMGPATLILALLAGQGAAALAGFTSCALRFPSPPPTARNSSFAIRHWSLAIGHWSLVIVIWAYSLPWSFVSGHEPLAGEKTPADVPQYEIATGQIGATSAGEYLPVWVRELPPADSLAPLYAASSVIRRFEEASLPPGALLLEQANGLTWAEVTFASPSEFTARFNFFYYPGWRAALDGQPVPLRISYPHGLITVPVPAGTHTLQVSFGSTPDRLWSGVASLAGVIVVAAIALGSLQAIGLSRQAENSGPPPSAIRNSQLAIRNSQFAIRNSSVRLHVGQAFIAAALLLARIFFVDEHNTIFSHTRFDGERVSSLQTSLDVNFDDRFALLGLDLVSPVTSGEKLSFTLYWRALQRADADYSISAQLLDDAGNRFGQQDSQHPGGYPTRRWPLDGYAADTHSIRVLPGTPPGTYRLVVGVYRADTGAALSVRDANGIPQGNTYIAAEVVVTRPARPPSEADLGIQTSTRHPSGPLELIGYNFAGETVGPGDMLPVTLFWRAANSLPPLTARLALVDPSGRMLTQSALPPARADYPTDQWTVGEIVRAPLALPIPADIVPGPTTLTLSLLAEAQTIIAGPFPLGSVTIKLPPRQTTLPEIAHPLRANFGGIITLLGYDVRAAFMATPTNVRATFMVAPFMVAPTVTLTLYWQSIAPAPQNYTVFTHLLNADGRVVAQSDSQPMGGTRPTSGWLPGEAFVDPHTLIAEGLLAPGAYSLEVGLYDPISGARLPVLGPDGQPIADHVILGQLQLPGQ